MLAQGNDSSVITVTAGKVATHADTGTCRQLTEHPVQQRLIIGDRNIIRNDIGIGVLHQDDAALNGAFIAAFQKDREHFVVFVVNPDRQAGRPVRQLNQQGE
nr:hypothetical protein [Pseudomonas syringae]